MISCPRCGEDVPELTFCVRCGQRLAGERQSRLVRPEFAAAPDEHVTGLHLLSTIFPQLPRADLESFRLALVVGAIVIGALVALGQLPAALVAAGVLVPMTMAVYLHDVQVYEDEPLRVVGLTLGWGAATGVAFALLLPLVTPPRADFETGPSVLDIVIAALILPGIELAIVVVGPLVLLPYRKFNEILDGTTFGATAAVAFVGAAAVVAGIRLTDAGIAPQGDALTRVAFLAQDGLLLPLLMAGTVGAVLGELWGARRGGLRRQWPRWVLGRPVVGAVVALGLLGAARLATLFLPVVGSLPVVAALAVSALVWLRLVIHAGLLDEALELPIGGSVTCANCGRSTPQHTFCGWCGVSLRALPKRGRTGAKASDARS